MDKVEILIVVDNHVDALLSSDDRIKRPALGKDGRVSDKTLLAEHGLSLLIRTFEGDREHVLLMDTAYNPDTAAHNLALLREDLTGLDTVVMSHGHLDHVGGLKALVEQAPGLRRLVMHPDGALKRFREDSKAGLISYPEPLNRERVEKLGLEFVPNTEPVFFGDGTMLLSGPVPRKTVFEKQTGGRLIQRGDSLEPDGITDDQSLFFDLAGKGLVVISGCAHAGIINTVNFGQELTGINKVHSVMGGFHLSGAAMAVVSPTVEGLKAFSPEVAMPMHCTGMTAIWEIAKALPQAFVLSSAGSKLILEGK